MVRIYCYPYTACTCIRKGALAFDISKVISPNKADGLSVLIAGTDKLLTL